MIVAYSTFGSAEDARKSIKMLLSENLIRCANLLSGHTAFYVWEERLVEENEVAVLFKLPTQIRERFIERLEEIHPYEVPAIVLFEGEASRSFGAWINEKPLN